MPNNNDAFLKPAGMTVDQMTAFADALVDIARKVMPEHIDANGKIKKQAPAVIEEHERHRRRAMVTGMQQQDPLFVLARNLREHFIPVAEKCVASQDTREAEEELREYKEILLEIEETFPEIRRDGVAHYYH